MDLKYAEVQVGEKVFLNHSKIKKEDAFEIIKDNSLKIIEIYIKLLGYFTNAN